MKSHNKKCIIYFIAGAMIFGTVGAFAGQYIATENTFPVQLNGKDVAVGGYNIDGSTYFKLRDIANVIGGFDVDFSDNTIQLSKDGYEYTKLNYSYVDKDYNFSLEIPHGIQNKYVITTDTNSNDYLKVIRFYEKNNYEYPINGEYHVGTVFNIYICDKNNMSSDMETYGDFLRDISTKDNLYVFCSGPFDVQSKEEFVNDYVELNNYRDTILDSFKWLN